MIGNAVAMEFEKGFEGAEGTDEEKSANRLIGDAINNFKTVQSFGYDHEVIKLYSKFVDNLYNASKAKRVKQAIAFGFS